LKAGLWFRRGRLFMLSPVRGDHRRFQAETPLIGLFKFPGPALRALCLTSCATREPLSSVWLIKIRMGNC
jgi:hypothetical protein